jgi:chromosomal replication initiation ATPase DnaA
LLLNQATIVEFKQPDLETLMSITLNKFKSANLEPGLQVVFCVAINSAIFSTSKISDIEGIVSRLAYACNNQFITLDLVKDVLRDMYFYRSED